MKREKLYELTEVWTDATRLRTPAERRAALETFLNVPFDVLLRFAKKHRKPVQRRIGPHVVGEGRSYIFAASTRENVLYDAVHIFARRSPDRIYPEQILICEQIIVGRIPIGCYWIREVVRAAAGTFGGRRIVNVDEFTGAVYPDFKDDFTRNLPRLKTYKFRGTPIRCAWSTRGLDLKSWARRLQAEYSDGLEQTLKLLYSEMSSTQSTDAVESRIRKALNRALAPLLSSKRPEIKLWGWRAWNAIGNDMPPEGFRHSS